MTLVRPNKVDLDAGQVRLLSDGTTLTTSVIPLKRYMTAPAPQKLGFETFREGPIGVDLVRWPHRRADVRPAQSADRGRTPRPRSRSSAARSSLAAAADPNPLDAAKATSPAILIDLGQGKPGILLTIDPATKLLSNIDMKVDAAQLAAGAPAGQKISIEKFRLVLRRGFNRGPQGIGRLPSRPPRASRRSIRSSTQQEQKHAVDAKVGKPAPNFTLTLLDGPGKTKTVTKAELAGKVVVIDFWATWCGPCLMELPEIQKLIESYADTKKDVVVVALSQDDEPSELAAIRKLVEKTLADKKINLTSNPVGTDRTGPEQVRRIGLRARGLPHARHPGRQGNRAVGPRRLQPRGRGAPAQDPSPRKSIRCWRARAWRVPPTNPSNRRQRTPRPGPDRAVAIGTGSSGLCRRPVLLNALIPSFRGRAP